MNEQVIIDDIFDTNKRLNDVIKQFQFISEARVTYTNTRLVNYMNLLYNRAIYNYQRAMFHASPGFVAILAMIWYGIRVVYNAVVWVVELIKLKEILQIAQILRIVWPKFREQYDAIMGKISEFSQQVGWGTDGLIHLIQAAQGGMNIIKGVTGKSFEWLQIAGAEKAMRALAFVSARARDITANPASVLDLAFNMTSEETSREVKTWWDNTMNWLNSNVEKAELTVMQLNDTINNLQELENKLPQFVRDFIPVKVWDSIRWVDEKIDNTVLPALTHISDQLTVINDQLQVERDRAAALAERLARPGDLLQDMPGLSDAERKQQEVELDTAVSQFYEEEVEGIFQNDQEIIQELASIQALAALDIPEPDFIALETTGRPGIFWNKAEIVDGWFVGDY